VDIALSREEPGGTGAAILSLLVHAVLFTVLVFGLQWQSKHPDAVVVELWSELPAFEPPPAASPKPEVKPAPKPQAPPRVEAKPSKPDIALDREKKPAKKAKKEEPLKFDNTQRIREQLAQEQQEFRSRERQDILKQFAQPQAAAPSADAGYVDKIRTKIKLNIVVPHDIKGNPEAIFDVVQLPTGEVISAKLRTSSGHRPYDDAVERAILKSSPLPRPDRPEQFKRELQLKFRPQE
jgi:colicin import membrane protein